MMFSLIVALALFQSTMAAEVSANAGKTLEDNVSKVVKDDVLLQFLDALAQCLDSLARAVIVIGIYVLWQRIFRANQGHKEPSVCHPRIPAKKSKAPMDARCMDEFFSVPATPGSVKEEDELSTSVGSSDSDSEKDTLASKERRWENQRQLRRLREAPPVPGKSAVSKKPLKAPRAMASKKPKDSATTASNSERTRALLEIISTH